MEIKGKGTVYYNTQFGKWSISDNQKRLDGRYDKYYIPVSFPKSMKDLPNDRDFISIEGFTRPFKKKDNTTGISYMILKWERNNFNNNSNDAPIENVESEAEDPYKKFGEEIDISDMLPF